MLGEKILYVREKKFYHQITRVILSHNPNHLYPPQPLPQKSNGRPLKHFYVVVDRAVTAKKCIKAWCTRRVIVLPIEAPWKPTQHCWPTTPNTFGNCCVCLHAKSLTGFKPSATTSKNMQQSVEKDAAFLNIQQCWELLANDIASICTGLKPIAFFVVRRRRHCHCCVSALILFERYYIQLFVPQSLLCRRLFTV